MSKISPAKFIANAFFLVVFIIVSLLFLFWAINFHLISYILDRSNYQEIREMTQKSPDSVVSAVCGDIELRAIDRDYLIEGGVGALGNPYTNSSVGHKYFLEGYKVGVMRFSTLNESGVYDVTKPRFQEIVNDNFENTQAVHVVDDKIQSPRKTHLNFQNLIKAKLPDEISEIKDFADCYSQNNIILNEKLNLEMYAFTISNP